ncbi:MAG: CvpA family protein [Clostridia bacterium]|nr:CvpA family protein [Clostridia bacterium]
MGIDAIIKWAIIGVFVLFLVVGFLMGLIRGIKRQGVHIAFVVLSLILAFLLTSIVTNAVLGIKISVNGTNDTISNQIIRLIEEQVDLSKYKAAGDFVAGIPFAVASPIVYMLLETVIYFVCDIIYLIVAKVSFGKKKEDFKNHKPNRLLGALVGTIEGFMMMFMLFAPITSLTQTASAIISTETTAASEAESSTKKMKTVGEIVGDAVPENVVKYINMYNDSLIGKVVSVGGIDNMMFDSMANFKVSGQKVYVRKDLKNIVDAYNNFVYVYNAVAEKNYNVSIKKLTKSLDTIVSSGIFKGVIVSTIEDVVLNYDDLKEDLNIEVPQFVEDMIVGMKTSFNTTGFNAYKYIRHDFDTMIDVAENVFECGLVEKFDNLGIKNASFDKIVTFIDENYANVKRNVVKITDLNVINDNKEMILDEGTKLLKKELKDISGNILDLNTKIDSLANSAGEIIDIAGEYKNIDEILEADETSLKKIVESDDIIKEITDITNLPAFLNKVGEVLDKANNISVLVLPVEEGVRDEKVYVFTNILKTFGIELLGDTVYDNDGNEIKIDTYQKFTNYLTGPIMKVKDLGLVDVVLNGGSFETVLDEKILPELDGTEETEPNTELLNEILLPFYQLSNAKFEEDSLKTIIFDKAIDAVKDNVSFVDFTEVLEADNLLVWKQALGNLGKTLKDLDTKGSIATVDDDDDPVNKTYFRYLKDGGDISTLSLGQVGEIIDIVKENAYNDGEEIKGLLDKQFAKIVYIMTGDNINSGDYSGETKNSNYKDVKAYLGVTEVEEYYQVNYQNQMNTLRKIVDFADDLDAALSGKDIDSNPAEYIEAFFDEIVELGEDQETVLEGLRKVVDGNADRDEFLTAQQKEDYGTTINQYINGTNEDGTKYTFSSDVKTAIKSLLGV